MQMCGGSVLTAVRGPVLIKWLRDDDPCKSPGEIKVCLCATVRGRSGEGSESPERERERIWISSACEVGSHSRGV